MYCIKNINKIIYINLSKLFESKHDFNKNERFYWDIHVVGYILIDCLPIEGLVQSYFVLSGDVLRWEQQVRLRHMTTRKYLCMDGTKEISLTDDNEDPQTVFRLYSVLSVRYTNDPAHLTNSSYPQYTHPLPSLSSKLKKIHIFEDM